MLPGTTAAHLEAASNWPGSVAHKNPHGNELHDPLTGATSKPPVGYAELPITKPLGHGRERQTTVKWRGCDRQTV